VQGVSDELSPGSQVDDRASASAAPVIDARRWAHVTREPSTPLPDRVMALRVAPQSMLFRRSPTQRATGEPLVPGRWPTPEWPLGRGRPFGRVKSVVFASATNPIR